jgi:hypothetical protein
VEAALPAKVLESDQDFRLAVFHLARELKAVPELRDRPAKDLKPHVRKWYDRARDRLGDRTFADTYARFVGAWASVIYAAGDDVVKLAWEMALQQPPPPEAVEYDDARIGRLMGLCIQLQQENELAGRGAWFALSGYTVEALLGVSQRHASTWLKMLVEDDFLTITKPGGNFRGGRRMAREYRLAKRP